MLAGGATSQTGGTRVARPIREGRSVLPPQSHLSNRGGIPMSNRIKLTFVLTTIVIVAALFLGTAVPKATTANSPYASTLSNYAVGTAVAAGHNCTNSGCEAIQGIVG